MWDIVVTAGTLSFIPALLPTLFDRQAFIPRTTSGITVLGLTAVVVGLFGAGLTFSPIMSAITGLIWLFIFVFRGRRRRISAIGAGRGAGAE